MGKIESALAHARVGRRQKQLQAIANEEGKQNAEVDTEKDEERPALTPAAEPKALNFDAIKKVRLEPKTLEINRILTALTDDTVVSAYKMLRTRVLQRMRANGWQALAISSTAPNEGKSLTAINLAISLAGNVDQQVFLVDLDLRRPSLQSYLGLKTKRSLSDYLDSNAPLESVLVSPDIDRLWIAANRKTYHNSSEMLGSPQVAKLVAELGGNDPSRILIFDLPPILSADDLLAFSPFVDAILLVVTEGSTRRADITVAKDLLQNLELAGVVLNKSSERTSGHYYSY